jgi:hypothetical protein
MEDSGPACPEGKRHLDRLKKLREEKAERYSGHVVLEGPPSLASPSWWRDCGPLILKLVNPIKVARSRPANERCIHQLLIPQADLQMRATFASVLRETNSAVRKELARFDLTDGCLYQLTELPAPPFINGCLQKLSFRCALSDEDNQSNIGDSCHPGITNRLWSEGQETLRLFGISGCRRFPIDDAFL